MDENRRRNVLGTTSYPQENDGIVWGASGVGKQIAYYFGMVSNYKVEKIIIEAQGKEYKDVPFLDSNGNRFFFIRVKGNVVPYSFKALSKNGEIIAPRPQKK
jgi:hypothetical protein